MAGRLARMSSCALNAGYSLTSEISEVVSWDTRDNRLNPTKGVLLRNALALGGLGGTQYYFRATVDGVFYYSLIDDLVFSIGGSTGFVQPFNNSTLLLNNRFYVGGDNLRGFRAGGIGPRDGNTTDALGGKYFYTATTELSFPLPGLPKELPLIGKTFLDVGSLWGSADNPNYFPNILDSDIMRVAPGVGVQWISPFGPIRIDYSWPIQKAAWDKTENVHISFGTRF